MGGFTSHDDLINEITVNGKFWRTDWNKNTFGTTAQTAGMWYCLFRGAGNPPADTVLGSGSTLSYQAFNATSGCATGIYHGGNVSSGSVIDYKCVLNASAFSAAATTMPAVFMLVDMLAFYPITTSASVSGSHTTLNTQELPRYPTGAGVQAFFTPSTVMGAATPNLSLRYTNADGVANRITPAVLPVGMTAAPVTSIVYSGTGAGKYGAFMPLQGGDTGIRSVEQIGLSVSYVSGALNLVLCKPILTLPMTTIGVAAERDLVNQLPSLPKVYDGACLTWLMYAGANTPVNSAFYGHLDFGWG